MSSFVIGLLTFMSQPGFPLSPGMTMEQVEKVLGWSSFSSPTSTLKGAHLAALYSGAKLVVHYDSKGTVVAIFRMRFAGCP